MLVADPAHPGTFYAGGWRTVFKSTDRGETWRAVTSRPWWRITPLALDPHDTRTMDAASEVGIWRSSNGGRTWKAASDGLFDLETPSERSHRLAEGFVGALAVDRSGAVWTTADGRVYVSRDRGHHVAEPIGGGLLVDPSRPGTLYAAGSGRGLVRSTDAGATWVNIGPRLRVDALAFDPRDSGRLLVATPGGLVERFEDRWVSLGSGRASKTIGALAFGPNGSHVVLAGTFGGGALKSTDGGAGWRSVNAGFVSTMIRALALSPAAP